MKNIQVKFLCFTVLLVTLGSARTYAVPITYTLVVSAPFPGMGMGPSGTLGPVSFGGALGDVLLTFTFAGDTSNVIDFTTPMVGHEILVGTASVEVTDASTGAVLAQGIFLSSAGIFVSVDNTNHGIGFGSFGALPPQFTGFQPVYPYAVEGYVGPATYDLRSDFTLGPVTTSYQNIGISCVGFPLCGSASPLPLPTTAGDLYVNPAPSDQTHGYYENVSFTTTVDRVAAGTWSTKKNIPFARSTPAVESINGIVYVAGGLNGSEQATLLSYDPTNNTWLSKASMPSGRYGGDGAGVVNGKLYVTGGWDNTSTRQPHNTLFVYDPVSNSWTTKAALSHLSGCGATGVINSKLYVMTGCNGSGSATGMLDVYDPAVNRWTSLKNSLDQHSGPAFGAINSKFYVAGGENSAGILTSTLEVFDPITNNWTTLAPMPIPVINPGSAALNGKLYVFGGSTDLGGTMTNNVQVYDPTKNAWWVLSTHLMPSPRGGMVGGAVAYGVIFAEGGMTATGVSPLNQLLLNCPSIP